MDSNTTQQQQVAGGQPANIRFGVYNQPAPVSGKTVGEVRQQFSKIWVFPATHLPIKVKTSSMRTMSSNLVTTLSSTVALAKRADKFCETSD